MFNRVQNIGTFVDYTVPSSGLTCFDFNKHIKLIFAYKSGWKEVTKEKDDSNVTPHYTLTMTYLICFFVRRVFFFCPISN